MLDAIGFGKLQDFRYLYTHKRRCINDFIVIYYGIAKRKQRLIRLLEFKIVDCYSQLLGNNP